MNFDKAPAVSVIIPVQNGARYIRQAIGSVEAQNYSNLELIIVDDGSKDETCTILRDSLLEFQLLQLAQHQGVAAARNVGIRAAKGELIAFLDSDDIWSAGHLSRRVRLLLETPTAMGSRGATVSFTGTGDELVSPIAETFTPFHLGASVFRSELFKTIGFFNETLTLGSDADFYFRCEHAGVPFVDDSYVSLYYRKSNESLSSDPKDPKRFLRGLARVLKIRTDRIGAA